MSKYENSLFPYSSHSTVNLPEWRLEDTNVTLISLLRLRKKSSFPKLHDKYCQNSRNL